MITFYILRIETNALILNDPTVIISNMPLTESLTTKQILYIKRLTPVVDNPSD